MEQEGRAEHSLLLYEVYSCSIIVPTVGLFFSSLEEYKEERLVLWLKAQSRVSKYDFFWFLFCEGVFRKFSTGTSFSVSNFCVFKAWLMIVTVYFFTVVRYNYCLGDAA